MLPRFSLRPFGSLGGVLSMLCPTDLLQLKRLEELESGMHVHQSQDDARCILYRARYQMSMSKPNLNVLLSLEIQQPREPSSSRLEQTLLPKRIPFFLYRCGILSLLLGTATGTLDCCPAVQNLLWGEAQHSRTSRLVRVCSHMETKTCIPEQYGWSKGRLQIIIDASLPPIRCPGILHLGYAGDCGEWIFFTTTYQ